MDLVFDGIVWADEEKMKVRFNLKIFKPLNNSPFQEDSSAMEQKGEHSLSGFNHTYLISS